MAGKKRSNLRNIREEGPRLLFCGEKLRRMMKQRGYDPDVKGAGGLQRFAAEMFKYSNHPVDTQTIRKWIDDTYIPESHYFAAMQHVLRANQSRLQDWYMVFYVENRKKGRRRCGPP